LHSPPLYTCTIRVTDEDVNRETFSCEANAMLSRAVERKVDTYNLLGSSLISFRTIKV
jgi:hypothetical protein